MTLMNGFMSAAFHCRRLLLAGAIGGKQGDAESVGVEDDGVSLAPERIPRLLVSLVTKGSELVVELVDLRGRLQQECQSHAIAATRWGPISDGLLGVEGQPQPTWEPDFNVRLLIGLRWSLHAESAIERERPCHIRDNQPDDVQTCGHRRCTLLSAQVFDLFNLDLNRRACPYRSERSVVGAGHARL